DGKNMIELLNVESAKSGKITADEACRGVSQYTLRYRYVTGSGLRPDTPKGCCVARNTLA
ncbi:hypothetical protein MMO04_26850, partial [Escherichia coli]|nr:hypothetical protein [Escherichia coli]